MWGCDSNLTDNKINKYFAFEGSKNYYISFFLQDTVFFFFFP